MYAYVFMMYSDTLSHRIFNTTSTLLFFSLVPKQQHLVYTTLWFASKYKWFHARDSVHFSFDCFHASFTFEYCSFFCKNVFKKKINKFSFAQKRLRFHFSKFFKHFIKIKKNNKIIDASCLMVFSYANVEHVCLWMCVYM